MPVCVTPTSPQSAAPGSHTSQSPAARGPQIVERRVHPTRSQQCERHAAMGWCTQHQSSETPAARVRVAGGHKLVHVYRRKR